MSSKTTIPRPAAKRENKTAPLTEPAFDWQDPLDLEGELSEEERMVRDTARAYAQEKLFPRVLTAYREEAAGAIGDSDQTKTAACGRRY